jgi:hypothetical protein
VDTLDKGMIYNPCGMEWDIMRFHHNIQNSMQLKTHELFIWGIFHLIFQKVKTVDKGKIIYKDSMQTTFLILQYCS